MILACLFKTTIVVYPLVIFIVSIKEKYKLKEMVKYASIVLTIFCIIMLPWWIRNYKDFNMFILFTKERRFTFGIVIINIVYLPYYTYIRYSNATSDHFFR